MEIHKLASSPPIPISKGSFRYSLRHAGSSFDDIDKDGTGTLLAQMETNFRFISRSTDSSATYTLDTSELGSGLKCLSYNDCNPIWAHGHGYEDLNSPSDTGLLEISEPEFEDSDFENYNANDKSEDAIKNEEKSLIPLSNEKVAVEVEVRNAQISFDGDGIQNFRISNELETLRAVEAPKINSISRRVFSAISTGFSMLKKISSSGQKSTRS